MVLQGYVDGISEGKVHGWVRDPDDPERRLTVRVVVDGRVAGTAVARNHRRDLVRAGIGDGTFGFRVPWPADLPLGPEHAIEVAVPGAGVVPLAADYVVRDADGADVAGVRLRAPGEPSSVEPEPGPAVRLLGEGGMLFDAADAAAFARERGVSPLSGEELARAADRLEEHARRVRAAGSQPAVVLVPAKLQVYPERLPPGTVALAAATPSAQLVETLADRADVTVVDLRPVLGASRTHGKTFLRSRPALTWLGAYHAALAVVAALAARDRAITPRHGHELRLGHPRSLPVEPLDAHVWLGGRMLPVALRGGLATVSESDVEIDPTTVRAEEVSGSASSPDQVFECRDARTPAATVVTATTADVTRLERMLAEHFRRTTVRRTRRPLDDAATLVAPDGATILLLDDGAVARIARA